MRCRSMARTVVWPKAPCRPALWALALGKDPMPLSHVIPCTQPCEDWCMERAAGVGQLGSQVRMAYLHETTRRGPWTPSPKQQGHALMPQRGFLT